MHRGASAPQLGLPTVAYELDTPAGITEARERVSAWLSGALESTDPALAGTPPLVSRPRRQYPKLPLIVLVFVGGITGALAAAGLKRYLAAARDAQVRTQATDTRRSSSG